MINTVHVLKLTVICVCVNPDLNGSVCLEELFWLFIHNGKSCKVWEYNANVCVSALYSWVMRVFISSGYLYELNVYLLNETVVLYTAALYVKLDYMKRNGFM